MEEIWKDIKGYEGLYQVSNFGRVKVLDRWCNTCCGGKQLRKGKILKQKITKFGYNNVGLTKDGKLKMFSVHRLVAQEFLLNPDNLPCVNHKDEVKTNNHVDNLEWCSYVYNNNYGTAIERQIQTKINNGKYNPDAVGKSRYVRGVLYRETHKEYLREQKKIWRKKYIEQHPNYNHEKYIRYKMKRQAS